MSEKSTTVELGLGSVLAITAGIIFAWFLISTPRCSPGSSDSTKIEAYSKYRLVDDRVTLTVYMLPTGEKVFCSGTTFQVVK